MNYLNPIVTLFYMDAWLHSPFMSSCDFVVRVTLVEIL